MVAVEITPKSQHRAQVSKGKVILNREEMHASGAPPLMEPKMSSLSALEFVRIGHMTDSLAFYI